MFVLYYADLLPFLCLSIIWLVLLNLLHALSMFCCTVMSSFCHALFVFIIIIYYVRVHGPRPRPQSMSCFSNCPLVDNRPDIVWTREVSICKVSVPER